MTPSALSHAMRGLEERLGVRLLTRSTRGVTTTEAGERLMSGLAPILEEIDAQIAMLGDMRETPAGTVRITADENAVRAVLWPKLRPVLARYPDIKVEIAVEYGLTDIVTERFDAGVRVGGAIAKDMIAVPIGPQMRMLAVAAPGYLDGQAIPAAPQDLVSHRCINLRLPTHGGLYVWEFDRKGVELKVRVDGQLVFNSITQIREAALDGYGIAYLPDTFVAGDVGEGRLVELLADWSEPFAGYHLYYPSRRQPTPAFRVVLEALRVRS